MSKIAAEMLFYLSKLLPQLVYPVGLVCVLLGAGLMLGRKRRWLRNTSGLLALAVLLVAGNKWVALGLIRSLEWRHPYREEVPRADVIVVLGGSSHVSPVPLPGGAAVDRLSRAATLYRRQLAPHVLLTGGGLPWFEDDWSEARRMAAVLAAMGVPDDAMWLEEESRNTRENALLSAPILRSNGIESVLLVTSALHMPRAVQVFETVGISVTPAPCDFVVTPRRWQALAEAGPAVQLLNLLPTASNLDLTTRALKEYLGLAAYRVRGWIG